MKHTPTPWITNDELVIAGKEDGVLICECNTDPHWEPSADGFANAEFIVKACNLHEELVEACKLAIAYLNTGAISNDKGLRIKAKQAYKTIEQALAKTK